MTNLLIIIGAGIVLFLITIVGIISRYRKCKSDQIMVVYGKTGSNKDGTTKSAKCIQGGAAFIWPIIQGYEYMSLTPLQFECKLEKALSSQNIRVDVPTTVTVAISTEPDVMQNAAERLLGLSIKAIEELVRDIVYGQMRTIIADMTIEELNANRDKFLSSSKSMIETELKKLGLTLININIVDIRDAAGYIEALGKKDETLAINNARIEIAKAEQKGAVQVAEQLKIQKSTVAVTIKEQESALAEANREQVTSVIASQTSRDSSVAEAEKDRDVSVANSKAEGEVGKIEAQKRVTISQAELGVIEARAGGDIQSANEIAMAAIQESKERANTKSEEARALRQEATLKATEIVPAEIEKRKKLIEAEGVQAKVETEARASANKMTIEAKGASEAILAKGGAEADVIRMKGLAEAEAKEKSLLAEANGFEAMIKAAESNPSIAIQYKLVNQYREIAAEQVKAFENIKFGNVTVMDTSNGAGLTDLMKNLISTVAPTLDVMKSMEIPGISKALRGKEEEFKAVE